MAKEASSVPSAAEANVHGASANQQAMSTMRAKARVIDLQEIYAQKATDGAAEPGKPTQLPDDPFHDLTSKGLLIEPPFDLLTLAMLIEHNTELGQCIEAMEVNIEAFGHRYIPRVVLTPGVTAPKALADGVRKEKTRLTNFFAYATKKSFVQFRRKLRKDLESIGNAYFEVIRDSTGQIQQFVHLPGYQMRLGKASDEQFKVNRKILQLQDDGSVKVATLKEWRRFRLYAQSKALRRRSLQVLSGFKMRWYKEFGDPRIVDNTNGDVLTDENGKPIKGKTMVPKDKQANEVVHLDNYSARTPYGLPRYIGNLLSLFGDRAAEEINFITFRNNNVPSMIIAVSNGQLTEGSIDRIVSFAESQIQGSDNYSKFLILEAEGLMEGEDGGQIKLDVKPLVGQQHKDALFQEYSLNNQDKIRRCFRLPPILVGRSDDYSRATAESSRQLADEQIFAPERDEFDAMMNRTLFPDMGIVYHQFKSNSPNTTDNQQLVKILAGAEKTGGMTPRIARAMLENILGVELPDFPEEFNADMPFSLTMAEAIKNKADPTEPGQQVTALKVLKALGVGHFDDDELAELVVECEKCGHQNEATVDSTGDVLVDHLMALNSRVEKNWRAAVGTEDDDHDHEPGD